MSAKGDKTREKQAAQGLRHASRLCNSAPNPDDRQRTAKAVLTGIDLPGTYSFFRELRRRKVFRGAAFYVIGAWLVLQVADVVAEPAGLPGWTMTFLIYAAVILFPLAVFLGWRYELTDHGLERTKPVGSNEDVDTSLRATDYLIVLVLIGISAAVGWQVVPERIEAVERAKDGFFEPKPESIAVLPFLDESQAGDQAYLAGGISDTVTHVLGQVKELAVTARTSTLMFRERTGNIVDIARELNVAHILEGAVQRQGDKVRIRATLVDARTGTELWSSLINREVTDIFAIQDEIASEVVLAMQEVLPTGTTELVQQYQPDYAAYEQLILGREAQKGYTVAGLIKADEYFRNAIDIDPKYVDAYVALAENSLGREDLSSGEGARIARPLLERALELDPLSAAAMVELAWVLRMENRFDETGPMLEKALEINPNLVKAQTAYTSHLMMLTRHDEALDMAQRAYELDPKNPRTKNVLLQAYWNVAQSERALALARELILEHPDYLSTYYFLSRSYMQLGKPALAARYTKAILDMDPESADRGRAMCEMYAQMWDLDRARQCAIDFLQVHPDDLDARLRMVWTDQKFAEALEINAAQREAQPWWQYRVMQQINILADMENWDEILRVAAETFPDLVADVPEINDFTIWPASFVAQSYLETGQTERGLALLDVIEAKILAARKMQAAGIISGIEDAQVYALRGERDKALATLEAAIDGGWMFYSWSLPYSIQFRDYWDDPEFQRIVQKLADRMAEQQAIYAEIENLPLDEIGA